MFTSIIVAIDGSDPSQKALETACGLAKAFNAELHLAHSPQLETTAIAVGYSVVDLPVTPAQIADAGKEVMEAAIAFATERVGTAPDSTIGSGTPAEDILELIALHDADLVVMGRRGLGSVASLFLGSVSQQVSRSASCSVLTVH